MATLTAERLRANLAEVRDRIAAAAARAGRSPADVELLAAVKYLSVDELPLLADAGIAVLGENRAQHLVAKAEAWPGRFRWHFIGALQSRKVRLIAPHVELIQSVASHSAMRELARHATPELRILIEVNVAGESGKAGVAPAELDELLEASPVPVLGLMTMPPLDGDSRRWFAALRDLASARNLRELSMGTTQDFEVAVEEGATIVRIGTILYRQ
jgi:hypothetical protein